MAEFLVRLLAAFGVPSAQQCDALHHMNGDISNPNLLYCTRRRFHYGPHRDHQGREWERFQQ